MTTATLNTTERYVEFVTLVTASPELTSQMQAVQDAEDIIRLAAANGFAFTTDELKGASRQARALLNDELSDDELEEVAGGFPGWGTIKKGLHYVRKAIDYIDDKVNGKK